jgi:hypothetical protein
MPSASMRAVTSADEPAGNSTVISSGFLCGKSWALTVEANKARKNERHFT